MYIKGNSQTRTDSLPLSEPTWSIDEPHRIPMCTLDGENKRLEATCGLPTPGVLCHREHTWPHLQAARRASHGWLCYPAPACSSALRRGTAPRHGIKQICTFIHFSSPHNPSNYWWKRSENTSQNSFQTSNSWRTPAAWRFMFVLHRTTITCKLLLFLSFRNSWSHKQPSTPNSQRWLYHSLEENTQIFDSILQSRLRLSMAHL